MQNRTIDIHPALAVRVRDELAAFGAAQARIQTIAEMALASAGETKPLRLLGVEITETGAHLVVQDA